MSVPWRSTRCALGFAGLASLVAAGGGTVSVGAEDEGGSPPPCQVSVPDRSRPPGEGFKLPGNGHLWAAVPADGRVIARERGSPGLPKQYADGSIKTKVLWLGRLSSKTRKRRLTITGKRLDGDGEPFRIGPKRGSWNGEALYWPGYVTFSAPGCWKVAGTAGPGTRIVFVISVEAPPAED